MPRPAFRLSRLRVGLLTTPETCAVAAVHPVMDTLGWTRGQARFSIGMAGNDSPVGACLGVHGALPCPALRGFLDGRARSAAVRRVVG